jgi:hypothetical protein
VKIVVSLENCIRLLVAGEEEVVVVVVVVVVGFKVL